MRRKLIFPIVAAAIVTVALAAVAYAYGFGGHGRHELSALSMCTAVMSSTQQANLKNGFSNEKQKLANGRQKVASAKKALTLAVLSGSKDLNAQESALSSAQQQLRKDEDAAAIQICGQLNPEQLSAAQSLFNSLSTLYANTRQQAKGYYQATRVAARQ